MAITLLAAREALAESDAIPDLRLIYLLKEQCVLLAEVNQEAQTLKLRRNGE
jgi:hypothetical protein